MILILIKRGLDLFEVVVATWSKTVSSATKVKSPHELLKMKMGEKLKWLAIVRATKKLKNDHEDEKCSSWAEKVNLGS